MQRQRWKNPLFAATSRHRGPHSRLSHAAGHGADENGALFRPIQNNPTARSNGRSPRTAFTSWCGTIRRCSVRDRRPCAARDGGHQRARPPGRHRQSAGMARPREHRHHAHLRSPPDAAGGQPDVQGGILMSLTGCWIIQIGEFVNGDDSAIKVLPRKFSAPFYIGRNENASLTFGYSSSDPSAAYRKARIFKSEFALLASAATSNVFGRFDPRLFLRYAAAGLHVRLRTLLSALARHRLEPHRSLLKQLKCCCSQGVALTLRYGDEAVAIHDIRRCTISRRHRWNRPRRQSQNTGADILASGPTYDRDREGKWLPLSRRAQIRAQRYSHIFAN